MKSSWLLLLMTPLFTYANYEIDDLYDCDYFSDAVVIEGESELVDEYTDLYTDAFYEVDVIPGLDEFEEDEVVAAPVFTKKEGNKRTSSQAISSKRSRNRPQVTHLQPDDSVADEQIDSDSFFQGDVAESEEELYEEAPRLQKRSQVKSSASGKSVVRKEAVEPAHKEQPRAQKRAQNKAVVREEAVEPVRKESSQAQKKSVVQKKGQVRPASKAVVRKEQPEVQKKVQPKSKLSNRVVIQDEEQDSFDEEPSQAPRKSPPQRVQKSQKSAQAAPKKGSVQVAKEKQVDRTPPRKAPSKQVQSSMSAKDSKADQSQMTTRRERLNERRGAYAVKEKKQSIVKSKPQKRWAVPSREELESLKEGRQIVQEIGAIEGFSEEKSVQAVPSRQERLDQPQAKASTQPKTRGTHRVVSQKSSAVAENETVQVEEVQKKTPKKRMRSYRAAKRPASD